MEAVLQDFGGPWLPLTWLLGLALGLLLGAWLGRAWPRRPEAPPPPAAPDFRALVAGFEASPHALALWDAQGRLLRCNTAFTTLSPGTPPAPGTVELPDGRWRIGSEGPLPGGLRLGLYTETALPRPKPAAPAMPLAPPLPPGRLRVLGVDDSPANLSVLRALLSNTGFALDTVTDGRAALDALVAAAQSGQPYDAVLMDVMMPGMDGLECTRRIRALPGPVGQVPVIPVTASSFPEDIAACHAAGMTGHVPKPVERVGLMRGIALALCCGDRPEEEALRPLFLNELANRMRELEQALAGNRPLLAPVHAIAGTVGHLGGAALVEEARQAMRALREADPQAQARVATLLDRLRTTYSEG